MVKTQGQERTLPAWVTIKKGDTSPDPAMPPLGGCPGQGMGATRGLLRQVPPQSCRPGLALLGDGPLWRMCPCVLCLQQMMRFQVLETSSMVRSLEERDEYGGHNLAEVELKTIIKLRL